MNLQSLVVNCKKDPIVLNITNHIFYYPTPANLSYAWSFGSLAGIFFALQIITGVILVMHYAANTEIAFASVEHIMTEVNGGYLFRYMHANGASIIFIFIYAHIGRGLYYQSYLTRPFLWVSGLIIFLLMMATAFIGYVLPWGQMSFWGATVITSLVTAVPLIGEHIAHWVWGGFAISNATLTRFFSLHYVLPFVVAAVILLHLLLLHIRGSSEPLGLTETPNKITFHPYFTYKDMTAATGALLFFSILIIFFSNFLGHPDNFLPANPLVTPAHIVPEWYFTPFYAILRACPDKLGGAISMFAALLFLFFLPRLIQSTGRMQRIAQFSLFHTLGFWFFSGLFFTLMFLGQRPAVAPYVFASQICTLLYFFYFLIFIPGLNVLLPRRIS